MISEDYLPTYLLSLSFSCMAEPVEFVAIFT